MFALAVRLQQQQLVQNTPLAVICLHAVVQQDCEENRQGQIGAAWFKPPIDLGIPG
jgi:hypothetical protein